VLGAVNARNQRMQKQLIAAQIEVAPDAFAMIMLRALP